MQKYESLRACLPQAGKAGIAGHGSVTPLSNSKQIGL